MNNEINISESSFKILKIPQTLSKPHPENCPKSKTDLDDLISLNNPSNLNQIFNNISEPKSISHLNSKHNKEFIKSKTGDLSKFSVLKNNIAEYQKSNASPLSKNAFEDEEKNILRNSENFLIIPFENKNEKDNKSVDEALDLSFRKISHISSDFHLIHRNLIDLNLSYNELVEIPKQLFELAQLKFLKLDFNKIAVLPSEIIAFKNLEFFSISNNKLVTLPENIIHLQNLKCLNIGKNLLKQMNIELTCLENLEILYIYGNLLESFPVSFRNMARLEEFAFEWFNYTIPAIDTIIKRSSHANIFTRLFILCKEMESLKISEISFINFIQNLSANPIDFNKSDSKLRNMLHIASLKDEISVIYNLTKEFPDLLNQVDKENQTPLTLSLLENKTRSIQILLDLGADPRKGGGHLGSALHLAAFKQDTELIEKFLSSGCCPNCLDLDKNTPLHLIFSIFSKNEEEAKKICELLMKYGCNPNLKNKDKWTALHLAVKRSQLKAITWAMEYNKKQKNVGVFLFDFDKRGGTHKFSPIHLAIHQGSLNMIEILYEAGCSMFLETNNYQTPKDMSYHSLLIVKLSRKLENYWIRKNLIKESPFKKNLELNVGNMKSKIEKTLNKQQSSVFRAEEVKILAQKENKVVLEKEIGRNLKIKSDKLILPNFLCNIIEEPVLDPEKSDNFDENIEEIEDLEEFNGTHLLKTNNDIFSRNITHGFNNITELNSRQNQPKNVFHKNSVERFIFQSPSPNNTLFFQNQNIMKDLRSLSLKNYIPELKRFIDVMMDTYVAFDEKLKFLWFMKALHYKIINYHRKYVSNYLPCSIYVLNEFYNPFERIQFRELGCDQSEYIPKILLEYFEKLLLDNKNSNEEPNLKFEEEKSSFNESPLNKIIKNNLDEKNISYKNDVLRLNSMKNLEKILILQELNRIFSELSYKRSKSTIKLILRAPWVTTLNIYESIQSLLFLLYYKYPSIKNREKSVPSKANNHLFLKNSEFLDDSKTFIKTLEEETPIKKNNISLIKARYKENMLLKNPFADKTQNKNYTASKGKIRDKSNENVKEDEANDAMELHLEKYFPSKSFNTPFNQPNKSKRKTNIVLHNNNNTIITSVKKKLK